MRDHSQASLRKRFLRYRSLYLFLLPAVLYVAIFSYGPMWGLQIAFRRYNPAFGILGSRWIGFDYFKEFISGYYFKQILGNTLLLSVYSMVVGFPLPILAALLLNEISNIRYRKFIQTVIYAPHFISTVVMTGIIVMILSPSDGLINNVLGELGFSRTYFMILPSSFKHIYVWSSVWQSTGWSAIIYLAALSGIDPALTEAATIDGASRFARIRYINFPTIQPTIVILLIMRIGTLIGVGFEKAFLLQNDLNLEASEVISTYVYRRGLIGGNYGFAAAVGLFNNVVNVILLLTANFISSRVGDTSLF